MNAATISLVFGTVASLVVILAYLDKRIRLNKARTKAQQGRIVALVQIIKLQGKRLTIVEAYLAKEDSGNYVVNNELIELEEEAMSEYRNHDTNLT